MKKTIAIILALIMTLVVFAACNNNNTPSGGTSDATKEPAAPGTTKPADTKAPDTPTTKQETTKAPTPTEPATTEAPEIPVPAIPEGIMVYHQDFDSFANTADSAEVAKLLGWQIRNKVNGEEDFALTDNTTTYTIEDGKLKLANNVDGATDSYMLMVGDSYMKPAAVGLYTIQYDVHYTAVGSATRYVCVLANYNGYDTYNSFHLRADGSANNQVRFIGSWYTYDVYGDFYAAGKDNNTGSSIANELYGLTYDKSATPLLDKDLTIRYQVTAEGPMVWIRDNSLPGSEFVCVSKPDSAGTGSGYWGMIDNYALCLKTGGKIDSYVDNISVWTGLGDEPLDNSTTAYETAIAAYLAEVNKAQ